ncbi:hypothetical protein ACIA8O_35810 [Kitasatospora sp. NPDC051853]|uniref:hypothetical protein n=1 Tax=Kitasatospora sp. NPDC051853 TaxID=3364058 RepID=UPI0037B51719
MSENSPHGLHRELASLRAERDVLRHELGDLRARLSIELGTTTDADTLREVRRLRAELASFEATEQSDDHRWSTIDDLIVANRKIHAVQAIRTEFDTSLPLALDLLAERHTRLRHRHPTRFEEPADTYWDGFAS